MPHVHDRLHELPVSGLRRLLNEIQCEEGASGSSSENTIRSDADAAGVSAPLPLTDRARESWIGPYRILGKIGEGGMGVVYRAYDSGRRRVVALKTLQRMNATALYRFKHEFRSLADISHPNLVTLYELLSDGERWCFTMELVDGITFLEHLIGTEETASERDANRLARLRDAFAQLAEGVAALHAAGTLHRDIKPSNVLVTREGRVVLLDFGLAAELDRDGVYRSTATHLIGTVGYMSPEQAAGGPISAASDWYSVGVMLYEALTGSLPFEGPVLKVLGDKVDRDPQPPAAIDAAIPQDLNALCVELLCRDPAQRPTSRELLSRLGSRSPRTARSDRPRNHDTLFVGRERELACLREAYQNTRSGTPVVAHVRGQSGAGKSALVHRFLEELAQQPDVVILAGRCHEQESVPFKALDSLLDSTARYLRHLPQVDVQALLPRDVRALTRVFPVLRQVKAFAEAPAAGPETSDAQELRRRASAALRELFARLGDRHPLVIAIDDLQWGDVDSASLLSDMLLPPDPPVFLGIWCCRTEDAEASPFLKHFRKSCSRSPVCHDEREVTVDGLDTSETRDLTLRLLSSREVRGDSVAEAIVRESAGRPFLVYELVEHLSEQANRVDLDGSLTLDEALWRRVVRLPEESRRLLEIVAVAGRPIGRAEACRAAGLTTDDRVVLPELRRGRLVRSTAGGPTDAIEAYHDRVRECVIAHLSPEVRRDRHGRLAETFARSPYADSEVLAVHLDGAGRPAEAAPQYAQAAAAAAEALAFDHAAFLYRRALELKRWSDSERSDLEARLGDVLGNAGRGADAAREYLSAAKRTDHTLGLELRRRAALQLLTSGHVDEGIAELGPVLRSAGTRLARTPWRALVSLLVRRAQLGLRGLRFVERREDEIPAAWIRQIDIGWSAVVGLSVVDPIRGADFQTRSLLLALRAGEPFRVARALAVEAAHLASSGSAARATAILEQAERLAVRLGHPYAIGIVEMSRGTVAFFAERWQDALRSSRKAIVTFRQQCTGAAWEIDTATAFSLWSLAKMGEIAELNRICPSLLNEAHERGDLYAMTNLSTQIMTLIALAADDPEPAFAKLDRVMRRWSQNGYHVQHHDALLAYVPLELYRGKPAAAWDRVQSEWPAFRWSLLSHVQDLRIEMLQMRAHCALAMAAVSPEPASFLASAATDARRLRSEKLPLTSALAEYIDGIVAAHRGDRKDAAARLGAAVLAFDAIDAHLYSAATRWRLAEISTGQKAIELQRGVIEWSESQGIRNPERMLAAFAPGF